MSKKRKKYLILAGIFILAGLWLFRSQSLMDIAKIDRETANVCSIVVVDDEGHRRGEFENQEAITEIYEMMESAEVRFDGWWFNTIRTEGTERLYHLRFYDEKWLPSSELFYFCTNGQIYYDHLIYKLHGEDKQVCTDILENLLQRYEIKE